MTSKAAPHLKLVNPPEHVTSSIPAVTATDFSAWFGDNCILSGINAHIPKQGVTCIVGPSGSGKSTFLRSLNRINDEVPGFTSYGDIRVDGKHVYKDYRDVTRLRAHIGMVFQKPCVFPRSIRENVLFGVRGQTLAIKPEIILLDEPTASVDPVTGRAIEDLLLSLKERYTIIMVTHDIRQTNRIADSIMFFCDGTLIESGAKQAMFSESVSEKTRMYLNEEFCDC